MGRRSLGKRHESSVDALRFLVELMLYVGSAAMFPRVTKSSTFNISDSFQYTFSTLGSFGKSLEVFELLIITTITV